MDERAVIARAISPNGELQLQRRGDDVYEIIYNGVFLMASYNEPSARALARLAFQRLDADCRGLRVLVGGLGMGYTLAEALLDPRVEQVDVVEIEPLIIQWNRDYLGELAGHPLNDPRACLKALDLASYLADCSVHYDLLLLDVDNGPDWLAIDSNERLYSLAGLESLKVCLAPTGVLAIWSAETAPDFVGRLAAVFRHAIVEEIIDAIPGSRDIVATIYLAYD